VSPTTSPRTRHYRFGLVGTPTKELSARTANLKIDNPTIPLRLAGEPKSAGLIFENGKIVDGAVEHSAETVRAWTEYYKHCDVVTFFSPYDWTTTDRGNAQSWPAVVTDPKLIEKYRAQEKLFREMDIVALRYGGWAVWTGAKEWNPWGKEMLAVPKQPTIWDQYMHTYSSPFVEYYVGCWALNARNLGVRGVRFDTWFPWTTSANPYFDEAWVSDVDGKTYGTIALWRMREMCKRLYRVFNGGEVEGGFIYHPAGGPPMNVVESFVAIRETGEGPYMKGVSLKAAYPQDMMRVCISGKPYGLIEQHNLKGAPLQNQNRIGACLVAGVRPGIHRRPPIDRPTYEPTIKPTSRIYAAWDWIDRATAEWHPHWENGNTIQTASSVNGEHYVSFRLQRGKRILLVATNYEKQPATITVTFDAAKLGFNGRPEFVAEDAITGETLVLENNLVRLDCGPELYRYVKIGTADTLTK
jgi:hypothetical protein